MSTTMSQGRPAKPGPGSRRQAYDLRLYGEFLEPARELVATPPSPAKRALSSALCGLFSLSLAAAWIGHIDIFAEAPGRIEPAGRSKVVQPETAGRVVSLRVHNGSTVRAGALLALLDDVEPKAARMVAEQQSEALAAEVVRRRLEMAAVAAGRGAMPPVLPAGMLAPAARLREQAVMQADLSQLTATLAELRAKVAENTARRQTAQLAVQTSLVVMRTLRERLSMRTTLAAEGWESRSNVLDALEELQREAEAQAASRGEILQADAERGTLLRDIVQTTAQFLDQDAQSLKDAQDRLDQAIQQTVKADAQLQHTQLRAPIAGTVQELAITTPGQVVSAGEQVMTLVPDTPKLEIEALVDNKDIGFVHPGQPVVIKVQAFTFTRYGTIGGHVVRVARDAVAAREAAGDQDTGIKPVPAQSADASAVPETQNLVYPVTVRLDRDTMTIDGRPLRLTPGMQATVDIKTGSRRALNYLLSPILQAASGAAHER